MKAKKRKQVSTINERRLRMLSSMLRGRMTAPFGSSLSSDGRIVIFRSELEYVSRCILDCKDIETGGQLFGYWTECGIPVILYAIGPGRKANHQKTFFNQDVDYLVAVGRRLKSEFGLWHIGEWHSHHQLGLARPSSHDVNTMVSTIREKRLGHFLLCIGNCDDRTSTLNGYLCDAKACVRCGWDVIMAESPVRRQVDSMLKDILVHPRTVAAALSGFSLGVNAPARPRYAPGYWLDDKANNTVFKAIVDHVAGKNAGIETKVQLNDAGEAVVRVESGGYCETILFPDGFPSKPPVITRYLSGRPLARSEGTWLDSGGEDILKSFINYYTNN